MGQSYVKIIHMFHQEFTKKKNGETSKDDKNHVKNHINESTIGAYKKYDNFEFNIQLQNV